MKTLALCLSTLSLVALISCDIGKIFKNKCPGTIRGKAVDLSGSAVADADIRTFPLTRTVATKGDGTFEIEEVLPGEYTLIGTKSGYNESRRNTTVISGQTSEITLYFDRRCRPPDTPANPRPADGLGNLPTSLRLSWFCNDPRDELRYDVYCDTTNPPYQAAARDLKSSFFDTTGLLPNTTYYWQVVAKDNCDQTSESPVWKLVTSNFEPGNRSPNIPTNPNPADGDANQPTSLALSWFCTDPDAGDILRYDIYLDTSTPPRQNESRDQSATQIHVADLMNNTEYYWKVVAKDNHGAETGSSIWSFTTGIDIPTDGLVLYLPFNSNASDESGNGNHGMVYGATRTADRFGEQTRAYRFDGVDDYILIENSNSLNIRDALTISAWVGFPVIPSGGSHILMKSLTAGTYEYGINLNSANSGALSASIGGRNLVNVVSDPVFVNRWYHVVATWQYPGKCKLYMDGVVVDSNTAVGNIDPQNCPLTIGRIRPGTSASSYEGVVDDIRIYNRSLSEKEIQSLYHEGGW